MACKCFPFKLQNALCTIKSLFTRYSFSDSAASIDTIIIITFCFLHDMKHEPNAFTN